MATSQGRGEQPIRSHLLEETADGFQHKEGRCIDNPCDQQRFTYLYWWRCWWKGRWRKGQGVPLGLAIFELSHPMPGLHRAQPKTKIQSLLFQNYQEFRDSDSRTLNQARGSSTPRVVCSCTLHTYKAIIVITYTRMVCSIRGQLLVLLLCIFSQCS